LTRGTNPNTYPAPKRLSTRAISSTSKIHPQKTPASTTALCLSYSTTSPSPIPACPSAATQTSAGKRYTIAMHSCARIRASKQPHNQPKPSNSTPVFPASRSTYATTSPLSPSSRTSTSTCGNTGTSNRKCNSLSRVKLKEILIGDWCLRLNVYFANHLLVQISSGMAELLSNFVVRHNQNDVSEDCQPQSRAQNLPRTSNAHVQLQTGSLMVSEYDPSRTSGEPNR
jgi:hypothetical protein